MVFLWKEWLFWPPCANALLVKIGVVATIAQYYRDGSDCDELR